MSKKTILKVNGLTVKLSGNCLLDGISFSMQQGEHLAVIGASGSGKTTLIKALSGRCFAGGTIEFASPNTKMAVITQYHRFKNSSNLSSFYYQQRFNSSDSLDSATVMEDLRTIGSPDKIIYEKLELLGISHVADTRLIQLSNGEHKRFQLAKALLKNPEWLLLDSPYTGLDVKARAGLNEIINTLSENGINIILTTTPSDIPSCITHVAQLEHGRIGSLLPRIVFENSKSQLRAVAPPVIGIGNRSVPSAYSQPDFTVAVKMVNTSVVYDNRTILDKINWEVKKGECWNVSGHNGSGKSTLLSLVNGDNPQAFANDIYLFDKKKGSGETIWDIKRRIGYVSPELHHYFEAGISCGHVAASGLFDTIGLFRQLSASQQKAVDEWMQLLNITKFQHRLFNRLSGGEQRLVLLARALVKNPPLLILDEPCQGLDDQATAGFVALINEICTKLNKTLIYVSHYEHELPACVTHTLKLEQGKVAA